MLTGEQRNIVHCQQQFGSDGESRWNQCLPCQQFSEGRPSCSSLHCIACLSWVTREHALWFSMMQLSLVSSKSWNGGTAARLDWTRQRSAPLRSSANSLQESSSDEQLMANWYSSCFPLAQLVPARMFVLCSFSYNTLKQTTNHVECKTRSWSSQIIWHF